MLMLATRNELEECSIYLFLVVPFFQKVGSYNQLFVMSQRETPAVYLFQPLRPHWFPHMQELQQSLFQQEADCFGASGYINMIN